MRKALELAQTAAEEQEVPVGAIIAKDGVIIAKAYNKKEQLKNSLYHAEIIAIKKASEYLGQWRLLDCQLYVSLEPCLMCAGAIISSRIPQVFFGADDKKAGAFGSIYSLHTDERLNHRPQVIGGILAEDSKILLQNFFKKQRH